MKINSLDSSCPESKDGGQSKLLRIKEVATIYGFSLSYLYKLTSQRKLPFYKPLGKIIFFRADEIEKFILSNRISTQDEIQAEAKAMLEQQRKGGQR